MKNFPPKRLIIIEADFAPSTPSAKSLCRAVPAVLDAGWEVEIWSSGLKLDDSRPVWRRVPRISTVGMFQFWFFSAWVTLRYGWGRMTGAIDRNTVVLSIGPYMLWANLPCIHFISVEYLSQMKIYKSNIQPSLHERIAHRVAAALERIMWRMGDGRRAWMVVSERLCQDLRRRVEADDSFGILPNSYDAERFNPTVRREWRNATREKLGIGPEEKVFVFVCLGGFERKGFPLALKACSMLIDRGTPCRLLVVGGRNSEPPDLRELAAKSGVKDLSFVISHGRDPLIEQLLAAGDALLFPSYFEAFSLVEIEAAALGLRLYLTPHYGSEMILRDGINGRILPWDADGIADILESDIRDGSISQGCADAGRAVTNEDFGQVFLEKLEAARQWIVRAAPAQ